MKRADRDNAIDLYIGEDYMDVLADGEWERVFTENRRYLPKRRNRHGSLRQQMLFVVQIAFFPFSDNVERAFRSGVKYIAQPGGSIL